MKLNETKSGGTTFREILRHWLIDAHDDRVTRKSVADSADGDVEMVGRWLDGQMPKVKPLRHLIGPTSTMPRAMQDEIVAWFHRNTSYTAGQREAIDRTVLDPTGDRIVDAKDTLVFQVHAVCKGGEAMQTLTAAMSDGRLDEAERAQVRSLLYEHRERVQRAIDSVECNGQRLRVAE